MMPDTEYQDTDAGATLTLRKSSNADQIVRTIDGQQKSRDEGSAE
jgi:hypothetical protein